MQKKYKWIALLLAVCGLALLSFGWIKNRIDEGKREKEYVLFTQNTLPTDTEDGLQEQIRTYNDTRTGYDNLPEQLGWIVIDQIGLKYQVYRTTEKDTLSEGIVHVTGTDLPEENAKTAVMVMGHNGEAGKALFTHLEELKEGDEVVLDFKNGTYTYIVSETEVVEPDLVHMYRDEGSTLTLVTCTPYGSNTHRLLVHCKLSKGEEV